MSVLRMNARVVVALIGMVGLGVAEAASVLDVTKLPQESGWSLASTDGTAVSVTSNGASVTLDSTAGSPLAVQWFFREVPFDFSSGFTIGLGLQVHGVAQPHNLLDAGVAFYASTEDPTSNFAGAPRQQLIFFDPGLIGWGDESATFAMDTTDRVHDYRLTVSPIGTARVFVDGALALERTGFTRIPRIGFGDMTNDPGVNGSFSISYIEVTAPPVPEPSAALLLVLGLGGLTLLKGVRLKPDKRKRQV